MKKSAFTLVELIVVITILAILGTIAFISLNNFSASARDAKRLSDVRSLYTKFTLENVKGTRYSNLVKDITTSEMQINSELVVVGQGVPDFEALKENRDNFLDPTTNLDYQVGFYEAGLILASTTDIQGIPNMLQIATYSEEHNVAVVVGNFSTNGENGADTKGLIKGEDGEILINEEETIIPGGDNTQVTCTNDEVLINQICEKSRFSACTGASTSVTSAPSTYPGCDTADIIVCTGNNAGVVISACNVGASQASSQADCGFVNREGCIESKIGKYFQWGNNYPFSMSGVSSVVAGPIDPGAYSPGEYSSEVFATNSTGNWATPVDGKNRTDLWYEGVRGPCAEGYHIPSRLELELMISPWGITNKNTSADLSNKLKIPLAGVLGRADGIVGQTGAWAFYWSTSESSIDNGAMLVHRANPGDAYYNGHRWEFSSMQKSTGEPIRCFKD